MKRIYFLALCLVSFSAAAADTPADTTKPDTAKILKPAEIKSAEEVLNSGKSDTTDEAKKAAAKKAEDAKKAAAKKADETKKAVVKEATKKDTAKQTNDLKKDKEAKKIDGKKDKEAKKTPVTETVGKLSAEQVVERNIKARGGLKAWQQIQTLAFSGKMDAGGKDNVQLPFEMKIKRAHKSRLEIQFQDQTAVQVYDGTTGWKLRPFLGRKDAEPFTAIEQQQAAAADELDGALMDYAKKGTKITLDGNEVVEGKDAYRLKLKLKDGSERRVWVDAKSFLEVKIDGQPRILDGKPHKVAVFYRDYKTDEGLLVPHVLETVVEGVKETHKMSIETVAVNKPIDDALFAKPQLAMAKVAGK